MPIRRSKHNYLREQERERRRGNGDRNLHCAAWDNNTELAQTIIEAGADTEDKDISGATPLHYAAWNDSVAVARLLIAAGADIEAEDENGDPVLANLFSVSESIGNYIEVIVI